MGEEDKPYMRGVDLRSYYLGMNYAFVEVVASGCKRLALSPPLRDCELDELMGLTEQIAEEYGVILRVDGDFLTTRLFNPGFTEGKNVILIAAEESVMEEYMALKELKRRATLDGNLPEVEEGIAQRFGRLLSYDEETIEGLLGNPRF